jgi:acyl-CoA thioester hydrolase
MTDGTGQPRRYATERALTREDFPVLRPVTTRWSDNDMFGHLNNSVYYELFDTAINGWLADATGRDGVTVDVIGVVAESRCVFFGEVGFPASLTVGLRVARLGRTSVTYQLGVFGDDPGTAAYGTWTHVYVDRTTRRPVEPPAHLRRAFESIQVRPGGGA